MGGMVHAGEPVSREPAGDVVRLPWCAPPVDPCSNLVAERDFVIGPILH